MTAKGGIATREEFFAHALAIEEEAVAHYRKLADQMRAHRNSACVRLFEHLAVLEEEHTAGLHHRSKGVELPRLAPASYLWSGTDSPESPQLGRAPHLMTPRHCLMLALEGEQRAKAFFERAAQDSPSEEVRKLAHEFAAEEQRHIEMVHIMLQRAGDAETDWSQGRKGPGSGG